MSEANTMDHNPNFGPGVFHNPPLADPVSDNGQTLEAEYVGMNNSGSDIDPGPPNPDTPASAPPVRQIVSTLAETPMPAPGTMPGIGWWTWLNTPTPYALGMTPLTVGLIVTALGVSYYLVFVKDAKPAARKARASR